MQVTSENEPISKNVNVVKLRFSVNRKSLNRKTLLDVSLVENSDINQLAVHRLQQAFHLCASNPYGKDLTIGKKIIFIINIVTTRI